jgi:hypothetical protein
VRAVPAVQIATGSAVGIFAFTSGVLKTSSERKLQTGQQTGLTVPLLSPVNKVLEKLGGTQGSNLEPDDEETSRLRYLKLIIPATPESCDELNRKILELIAWAGQMFLRRHSEYTAIQALAPRPGAQLRDSASDSFFARSSWSNRWVRPRLAKPAIPVALANPRTSDWKVSHRRRAPWRWSG